MSDAVILVNEEREIVTVNPAGLELFNTRIETIKGTNLDTLFPEENEVAHYAELVKGGDEIRDKDVMLVTRDGKYVPASLSMSTLEKNSTEPAGLLIIARDISERIKYKDKLQTSYNTLENRVRERTAELVNLNKQLTAEAAQRKSAVLALQQSEAMFRLISEQSLMGIVMLKDNRVVYANDAWADITEFSIEEMKSWDAQVFLSRVHPDDRAFMIEQAEKKQAGDLDYEESYDWRLLTKNGKLKWISMYSKPVPYGDGNADLATLIDISDKKNIFLSLQESEAKYRLVVENANDGIFILQDEVIRFVNQKACDITGYPREELLITPFADLIHPDDRQPAKERYEKRIDGVAVPTTPLLSGHTQIRRFCLDREQCHQIQLAWKACGAQFCS